MQKSNRKLTSTGSIADMTPLAAHHVETLALR